MPSWGLCLLTTAQIILLIETLMASFSTRFPRGTKMTVIVRNLCGRSHLIESTSRPLHWSWTCLFVCLCVLWQLQEQIIGNRDATLSCNTHSTDHMTSECTALSQRLAVEQTQQLVAVQVRQCTHASLLFLVPQSAAYLCSVGSMISCQEVIVYSSILNKKLKTVESSSCYGFPPLAFFEMDHKKQWLRNLPCNSSSWRHYL